MNSKNARPQALQAGLSDAERQALASQLHRLLARLTREYTGGDTSIPAGLAKAFLQSALYCMGIYPGGDPARGRQLLQRGVDRTFADGQRRLELKLAFGRDLWLRALDRLPPVENRSMQETLHSIGSFWTRYNPRYLAHEIPCDIDYQLALPVSNDPPGVNYVIHYLEQLIAENDLLRRFPADAMIPVLNRFCPDYFGLHINLFEPVAANALGRTLLDLDPLPLDVPPEACSRLQARFDPLPVPEIRTLLRQAALQLAEELSIEHARTVACLTGYAEQLCPRIASARDTGGMDGIFLSARQRTISP